MALLEHELARLDVAVAAATAVLQERTAAVASLTQQQKDAAGAVPAARDRVTQLTSQRQQAAAGIPPFDQALQEANAALAAAQQQTNAAEAELEDHDANPPDPPETPAERAGYAARLAAWRKARLPLQAAVTAAQAALTRAQQAQQQAQAARSQADAAVQALDRQIQRANGDVQAAQGHADDLGAQLNAAGDAQAVAQRAVDDAKARVTELSALRDTVTRDPFDRPALEKAAAELERRLRDVRDRYAAAVADRDSNLATSAQLDGEIGPRQAELDALHSPSAIPAFEAAVAAQTAASSSAQQRLASASGELDQLASEIAQLRRSRPQPPRGKAPRLPIQPNGGGDIDDWLAEIEDLRSQYEAAKNEALAATRAFAAAQVALAAARQTLQAARAREQTLVTELADRRARQAAAKAEAAAASAKIAELDPGMADYPVARETATALLLGSVPGDRPLVLLPVRLEARFRGTDLLLRIYPDRIHVDTHEPELTADELAWGTNFAQATVATKDDAVTRAAWGQLAGRFGPERAAWIAAATAPASAKPGSRAGAWTRPPRTSVLPDRWVAIGYGDDGRPAVTVWGKPVKPDPLPVGPEPAISPLDAKSRMLWMLDFDAAVASGMGLRVPLAAVGSNGFSRVLVVGIKAALTDSQSTARLEGVLAAHHYTDGLAFVAQRTPTNNSGNGPAGYRSDDPGFVRSYAVERLAPLSKTADGSDGDLVAGALGVNAGLFAHVAGADGRERQDVHAMNAALWPALDGSLLRRIADDATGLDLHTHFVERLSAQGPLAVVRTGNQPYAILPATSLDRWAPSAAAPAEAGLVGALRAIRDVWRGLATAVRIAGRGGDLATIGLILQEHGTSAGYVARQGNSALALGPLGTTPPDQPNFLTLLGAATLKQVTSERYPGWNAAGAPRPQPLLYLLLRAAALCALAPDAAAPVRNAFHSALAQLAPRQPEALAGLAAGTLDLASHRLDAWVTSLATGRLHDLRTAAAHATRLGGYGWLDDVRPHARPVDASGGFVQAPSIAQAATAAVLRSGYLAHRNGDSAALAVDLSSARVRLVEWLLAGVRQGQSLGALLGYRFERSLHDAELDRFIAPLRTLAAVRDDSELGAAMDAESAATTAWRAVQDALQQAEDALAAAQGIFQQAAAVEHRLEQERADLDGRRRPLLNQKQQLQANLAAAQANLAAAQAAAAAHAQTTPETKTVRTNNKYETEVEIPDRAAILQWGRDQADLERRRDAAAATVAAATAALGAFTAAGWDAVIADLNARIAPYDGSKGSIARAQADVAAKDAAAQGLATPIPALRTQEGQAEATLDARRADVTATLRGLWAKAIESIAAHNVVDGLQLHRRWKAGNVTPPRWDGTTIPFGVEGTGLPSAGTADYAALEAPLSALADLVDAVSDAVVAESVHQLVQGNPVRSGGTIDAIAGGESAPPELEVVRTPRTGSTATHRIVALFAADGAPPDPWKTGAPSPRALAEPVLNAWAAQLLPRPATVRVRATLVRADGTAVETIELKLDALKLSPLDVLYLPQGAAVAQESELEQRLGRLVRTLRPAAAASGADVRLSFERDSSWTAADVSVPELLETARAARTLAAAARALDGRDLARPEDAADSAVDAADLGKRADAAVKALTAVQSALKAALARAKPDDAVLSATLAGASAFGVAGAVPVGTGLVAQAQSVSQEAARRLALVKQAAKDADGHVARLHAVFGDEFLVLKRLVLPQAAAFASAFAGSAGLVGDPGAPVTWFHGASRVRDGVARLQAALTYAEALQTGASLSLRVAQLPAAAGERWVALPPAPGTTIPGGRLSLVAQAQPGLDLAKPVAGILIDEWVEVVPSAREVTGVAFHYDQPNAEPPQAILLAVAPDLRPERVPGAWDLDTLEAILRETLELARLRAVAPEDAAGAGELAPALFFSSDTIDFARATAPQGG